MADDPIEQLEAGWNAELPDLDTKAMATVARLNRSTALLLRGIEERMATEGSSLAEFDVISSLRRAGPPYQMNPSAIARSTMLSPSGMTHRLDKLEASDLLERVNDPDSRRTMPVALTEHGIATSERLARALAEVEAQSLAGLSDAERAQLDQLLAKLLDGLDSTSN